MKAQREEFQRRVSAMGYPIVVDGILGPKTRDAFMSAMRDPADPPLADSEIVKQAQIWQAPQSIIRAIRQVESTGPGFTDGISTILPEPHRFSKSTGHKYDASHPHISSRRWNKALYARLQSRRWEHLWAMIQLDPDAGMMSASYGSFQVLGENYKICGEATPFDFVKTECTEGGLGQFRHFCRFIESKGLVPHLRARNYPVIARVYNGTAYRQNGYDVKIETADNHWRKVYP